MHISSAYSAALTDVLQHISSTDTATLYTDATITSVCAMRRQYSNLNIIDNNLMPTVE